MSDLQAVAALKKSLETLKRLLKAKVLEELQRLTETDPGEDHQRMLRAGLISAAASKENIAKNRYSNILPLDSHRVILPPSPLRVGKTDFVNATRLDLKWPSTSHLHPPIVIASQGPLHPDYHGPDTCGDFWHAVLANDVGTIVALANVQPGFSGSAQYFPTVDRPELVFDGITAKLVEEKELSADVVCRTINLILADGGCSRSDPSKRPQPFELVQLHYRSFPNYGVPRNTLGLRLIINEVEKRQLQILTLNSQQTDGRGLLVHCSGGIGRTGVFLAAYHTITSVLPHSTVPSTLFDTKTTEAYLSGITDTCISVEPVVRSMRKQRHPWMVEGLEQYAFVYLAIVDELTDRLNTCEQTDGEFSKKRAVEQVGGCE